MSVSARFPAPPRTIWKSDFPPVIAHVNLKELRKHPSYRLAKAGEDDQAALRLVYDLIVDDSISAIEKIIGNRPARLVSVHAEEHTGRNKIPAAYAEVLGEIMGLTTDPRIVQSSISNHGSAPSIYHRLVCQPSFNGYVEADVLYYIVDDTCTAGGTLANLKGFIEHHGGNVIGMSVMALPGSTKEIDISLADSTLGRLKWRHPGLERFWREEFGHELNTLTEGEAGHLRSAPSVDAIRNRLAEARRDLHLSGDEKVD